MTEKPLRKVYEWIGFLVFWATIVYALTEAVRLMLALNHTII